MNWYSLLLLDQPQTDLPFKEAKKAKKQGREATLAGIFNTHVGKRRFLVGVCHGEVDEHAEDPAADLRVTDFGTAMVQRMAKMADQGSALLLIQVKRPERAARQVAAALRMASDRPNPAIITFICKDEATKLHVYDELHVEGMIVNGETTRKPGVRIKATELLENSFD
jgi:hypothetical protein